ncbi:MAG: TM0106 family RecB-like putative nuclease [bacterium]
MKRTNLDELLRRAAGDRQPDRNTMFRPHMLRDLIKDPYKLWCDWNAPREQAVEEPVSRYDQLKMQRGIEFANEWIRKHCPGALRIEPEFGEEALINTLRAMQEGVPAIQEPQLWLLDEEVYGKGDLIVRSDDTPSDLGNFHYKLKELKSNRNAENHHVAQAGLYNKILGRIQGYLPPTFSVVLRTSEEIVLHSSVDARLNELLNLWRGIRDGNVQLEPAGLDKTGSPWRQFANRVLNERMDLTLLPGVGPAGRDRLRRILGIESITDLYRFSLEELVKKLKVKRGSDIFYHAQAYQFNQPVLPAGHRVDLPAGKRNIFFDFETSDDTHPSEPPHVYLIGTWDAGKQEFAYFLAEGAKDETRIFKEFMDYIGDTEGCVLMHWANFEIAEMNRVGARHPEIAGILNTLTGMSIDLKNVIKRQIYLPVHTYSIKAVAPFCGFNWQHEDVDAMESMVLYWDYLETGDRSKIQRVIDYNRDDCLGMAHVYNELSGGARFRLV